MVQIKFKFELKFKNILSLVRTSVQLESLVQFEFWARKFKVVQFCSKALLTHFPTAPYTVENCRFTQISAAFS